MFKPGDKVRWYGNFDPKIREKVFTIKEISDTNIELEELPYNIVFTEEDEDNGEITYGKCEDYFCHATPPKPIEEFL